MEAANSLRGLRDLLLQRVARLSHPAQALLRLAAAAGREVRYPLLRAITELAEGELRDSLRQAVEHGILVAEPETGSFRFRHALLAEAVYATILPGEREGLHAWLAGELARSGMAGAAELAPHWAAAGRPAEAFVASIEAARQAEAVFGLAEAHAHLERALALWPAVPDAAGLAGIDLAGLCAWTAGLASHVGAAPRAVELARRAIELVGSEDPHRAALLQVDLGEYLYEIESDDAALAALERAVELVPAEPPSAERAYALGSLAGGVMVAWRHAESLPIGEQALALARELGAGEAEVRALTVLGGDLVYLGRGEEGAAHFRRALQLAEEIGDHLGLARAYTNFTDALTMLGRLSESARLGQAGLKVMRRYGISNTLLVANQIEALLAIGDWDEADRLSGAALRGITSSFPYWLLTIRADVEIGRGEFDAARAHLQNAGPTLRENRVHGLYDACLAELALWERRWTDADAAIQNGLAQARQREAAHIRVQMCAKGLRAQAELVALARARRDAGAIGNWLTRARELITVARRAAAEASAVTPNAGGWLALAEAEYERARGPARPQSWSQAAAAWQRLERPPRTDHRRLLDPAAKLATARMLDPATASHSLGETLGLGAVPVRELYTALDWLGSEQSFIENNLARRHLKEGTLVLYDVTSTYLEGSHCPLAHHGYSRDKRSDRPQLVIGLLCAADGCPVAVEVFEGNTADPATVASQIAKLKDRFRLKRVVVVGDRGMITDARIEQGLRPAGLDWASGLLPVAPGRGARRSRRLPHRGGHAGPGGARRRGPDRGQAAAPRTRAARPARAARPRAPAGSVPRTEARPRGNPRPDPARGAGPEPPRPRLHQPRDRRGARHQRQDRQRPRLAHPAQTRGAQQARGRRDHLPPRPATIRAI